MIREAVRAEVAAPHSDVMLRAERCEAVQVTERTVVAHAGKEGLPVCKLLNGWRFFRSDVIAWMKAGPFRQETTQS